MQAADDSKLPQLREDLQLLKGAPTITGKPTWLIFDPVAHRYFQVDQEAFRLLSIWNRYPRIDQLQAAAEVELGAPLSEQRIGELTAFIARNNMVIQTIDGDWRHYHDANQRRDAAWWKTAVHSYLFFRIPLLRPHRLLQKLLPLATPFLSRIFLLTALVFGIFGIYLTSRQWDAFLATFADFYSLGGIVAYLCALVVIKLIHELAHAFTAARFGCRVPSMGVALLVMMPVLYTDVTDAWKLTSRRQRLLIAGAGMIAELTLAAFATFLWAFLPDGNAKSICFVVATTSWVLSLVVNLNPFMRFDGYYLTADALGIENLQPRAFDLGRWKLRELLFGLGTPCPEVLPQATRRLLVAYAWATWLYRLVLFVGIALLVYYLFFKALGIILFVVEIVWFIGRPVWAELKEWFKMRDQILKRPRTYASVCAVAGLIALGLMPLSTSIEVPAVTEAQRFERIYPIVPAQIKTLQVVRDQQVAKGDILLELTAPEIDNQLMLTKINITTVSARLDRVVGDKTDKQQLLVLQRELAALRERQAGLNRQRTQLVVTAPFDGRIVDIRLRLHAGRWVGRDAPLLSIAADGERVARGYLSERDLWRMTKGATGRFIPDDITQDSVDVDVSDIAYSNSARLELPYLASVFSGPIAVTGDDVNDLVPAEAQYLVTMRLADAAHDTRPVQRGIVRMAGKPESVLSGLWRQTLKVLVRESGV